MRRRRVAPPITEPVYLDAISHKSEINLITRRGASNFSSDLSLGRRPTSKSDEKSEAPLLIVELQRCRKVDFGQKWFSYWRRDPTGRYVPSEGIPAPQYDHSMFAASAKPWPRSAILAHTSAQSRVEKLETRRTLCVAWRGSKDHHQSDLCRTHEQRLSRCNGGGCT